MDDNRMQLKIDLLRGMFRVELGTEIAMISWAPDKQEMTIVCEGRADYHINGKVYDLLEEADTIEDVLKVFQMIAIQ